MWEIEGGEENVVEGVAELSLQTEFMLVLIPFPLPIPGHSTIDGKVKGVREADKGIADQNDILSNIVIHEVESKTIFNLKSFQKIHDIPVRECVKSSDDHEWNLSGEEHTNDYNQHQGSTLGIPLLSAFSDNAATEKEKMNYPLFKYLSYKPSILLMQRKLFSSSLPCTANNILVPIPSAQHPAPPHVCSS